MNSWNVPGQSDARGAIRNLAKTNIIFVLATRFRGGARVPARLVFRHVFIATFDAPIPTRVYNHAFYQLILFSLTNNAPVKHLIIYVGGIYRAPRGYPNQIFAFSPCLSGNFLHFPSIICMCVVFELK